MSNGPVGVGVIGAGVISDTYLENLSSFPDVKVLAISDLIVDRARERAEQYDVPVWGENSVVLEHPDVQVVVNLTTPDAHIEVSRAAIAAGKHIWSEKPLGLDLDSARSLLEEAAAKGLRIGNAPDTVLGPGFQTAKRAIQDGVIGRPLFAMTSMQWQGPELFHPDPAFLFARGAGPMLDIGPYYMSALVSLFGPIAKVAAVGMKAREEREVLVGPKAGETFPVEPPSTISVLTAFEAGQQAQSMLSFDSPLARHGVFEVHGTEGSLIVPDPNRFEGAISYVKPLTQASDGGEIDQPSIDIPMEGVVAGRGTGLLDMVRAIAEDRPHVASGELAYHVLEVMLSAEKSAETGEFVTIESTVAEVPAVPVDFDPFASTLG